MKLVRQEKRTSCGVACVAMVVGITHAEAAVLIGKNGYTQTKDLVKALRKQGFSCPDRLQKGLQVSALSLAIARLKTPQHTKSESHWVVVKDGLLYDPGPGKIYLAIEADRITSILPITRP